MKSSKKLPPVVREFLSATVLNGYERFIDGTGFREALAHIKTAPIIELPKYINHPSPIIRSIIRRRLSNG